MTTGRDDIAAGLAQADQAREGISPRRRRLADLHRPSPELDGMKALYEKDREEFERVYGPSGLIALGLATNAAGAAEEVEAARRSQERAERRALEDELERRERP